MRLFEIYQLIESYPVARKTFMQQAIAQGMPEDKAKDEVDKYINTFRKIQHKLPELPNGKKPDIVQATKMGWDKFKDLVDDWKHAPTSSELKKAQRPEKSEQIFLYENDQWLIIIPLSHKSSCFYGKKSSWCTTKQTQQFFKQYFFDNSVTLIYLIHKAPLAQDMGGMYAIAYHNNIDRIEMFNKDDDSIDEKEFKQQTGFNPESVVRLAKKKNPSIEKGREEFSKTDPIMLAQDAVDLYTRNKKAEKIIMRNPHAALNYAQRFFPNGWPQAEAAIATNPNTAYEYARNIIHGRFKKGEKSILQDPRLTSSYLMRYIKDRWPEGEPVIAKNAQDSLHYAKNVIKDRFKQGEPAILKDRLSILPYVTEVINKNKKEGEKKERWPEAEAEILKDTGYAIFYANNIIGGRWEEAEPEIMKYPGDAFYYAKNIIKDEWPEAEKYIMKSPRYAYEYTKDVINKDKEDMEEKERWPEAEKYIMKDPTFAFYYAKNIIGEKWPEAEPFIKKEFTTRINYNNTFNTDI